MKPIAIQEWTPADGMTLESNAFDIVTKTENNLIVAGPGAGKTELLAQKACFLLQTNTCKFPHKILAISFKKDAAHNLKERVKLRCEEELAKRFDSFTFDSFAKLLLDHFKEALPTDYRIKSEYDILLSDRSILEFYEAEDIEYYNTTEHKSILSKHHSKLPFLANTKGNLIRIEVWTKMIRDSKLSFQMIMRLAELIIDTNPKIKQYIQKTYHFVFLDEFQDTTEIQYSFFKSCFLGSKSIFTAVGDDKQRIMKWAGAQETIFEDFIGEAGATRIPLTMNFRCAPRLVTLLNHLTKNLLGKFEIAIPSPKWRPEEGECFVWVFQNPTHEMQILFQDAQQWITRDGINPRNICILVKQKLENYAGDLIKYFNKNGIKARDENIFQELLTHEVSIYVINVLCVIFQKKPIEAKKQAFIFLSNLQTEHEDKQLLKLEISFSKLIKKLKSDYVNILLGDNQIEDLIREIINFANRDLIIASSPSYKNIGALRKTLTELYSEILKNYHSVKDMDLALNMLLGVDTIPVMTIHKSKGLEYHTVIFIGLEDDAFWSFDRQPDEDKCAFFVALSRAKERVVFTFSKQRKGGYGLKNQSTKKIQVIFDELDKSGIVSVTNR
jgi:DNA helicase-2/ATP-dependent DNA helicase PcrA